MGVSELMRAHAAGRRGLVGLTFDDGYADFLRGGAAGTAGPRLHRDGLRPAGTAGGVNEWDPLGPRKPLLTLDEIRRVAGAGMEVGSHGLLHQDLTELSDEELRHETVRSRELIGELTGVLPEGFCYPYGTFDRRVSAAVGSAGYGYGCALAPGPLISRFALPRTHVSQADRGVRLWAKDLRHGLRHGAVPGAGSRSGSPARAGGPR